MMLTPRGYVYAESAIPPKRALRQGSRRRRSNCQRNVWLQTIQDLTPRSITQSTESYLFPHSPEIRPCLLGILSIRLTIISIRTLLIFLSGPRLIRRTSTRRCSMIRPPVTPQKARRQRGRSLGSHGRRLCCLVRGFLFI